jgi:uncharacterized oligopeptide transporter (OPT) family protein
VAFGYALLQKVFHVIAEVPFFMTRQTQRFFPSAKISGEITPEYLGVGYIIGPRIAGVLVAGGVLSWFVLIPLTGFPGSGRCDCRATGKTWVFKKPGNTGRARRLGSGTHNFDDWSAALYRAYVRQIGAGAVAAGGFITLIKTIPTIISSFKGSIGSLKKVVPMA